MTQESGPDGIGGLRVGDILDGRYVILGQIGNGEMGVVYLAVHQLMNQKVAIKVLRSELVLQPSLLARFDREASMLAGMSHRNVVAIHDSGVMQTGQRFLVMSYVDGASLKTMIERREVQPLDRLLQIFMQACDGLAHVHEHGIIHRDLKPSNIMVSQSAGEQLCVQILDFGIARFFAVDNGQGAELTALTRAGERFLSPKYMSPEQCLDKTIDLRSDVYSLGCVMYEALTGRPPFDEEQPLRLVSRHVKDMPPPMVSLVGEGVVPRDVERIVMRAMAKDPGGRQQNMNELKADLDSALRARERKSARLPSRSLIVAAAIVLLVMAVANFCGDRLAIFKSKFALIVESNLFPSIERRIRLLRETVDHLSRAGEIREAAQMQAQLLSAVEQKDGHVSMQAAMASKKAADLYRQLNDRDCVKKYSKRSADSLYQLFKNRASLKTPVDGRLVCQEILDAYRRKDFLPLDKHELNFALVVLDFAEAPELPERNSEIIAILLQAVELFQNDPSQKFLVTFCWRSLARVYLVEGKFREALGCYEKILKLAEKYNSKPSDTIVDVLIQAASVARSMQDRAKETQCLKQALDIASILPPETTSKFRLLDARQTLAESLEAQGFRAAAGVFSGQVCLRCKQAGLSELERQQCSELKAAGRLPCRDGR